LKLIWLQHIQNEDRVTKQPLEYKPLGQGNLRRSKKRRDHWHPEDLGEVG